MSLTPTEMSAPEPFTWAQLTQLRIALDVSEKALQKQKANKCDQPIVAKNDEDNPKRNPEDNSEDNSEATKAKQGYVDLSLMSHWLIRDVPENPGQITPAIWAGNKVYWDVKQGRLTDLGCILALLILPKATRKNVLRYDFDARGNPRRERVPRGQTVVITQNNVQFLLAWKGTYVFTGGTGEMGWLLRPTYPENTTKEWFKTGKVLAPIGIHSSNGTGGLNRVLTSLHSTWPGESEGIDFKPKNGIYASTWDWAHMRRKVTLHGTAPDASMVIVLEDGGGYIPMASIPGFSSRISTDDPNTRPANISEVVNAEGFHHLELDTIKLPTRARSSRRTVTSSHEGSTEAQNQSTQDAEDAETHTSSQQQKPNAVDGLDTASPGQSHHTPECLSGQEHAGRELHIKQELRSDQELHSEQEQPEPEPKFAQKHPEYESESESETESESESTFQLKSEIDSDIDHLGVELHRDRWLDDDTRSLSEEPIRMCKRRRLQSFDTESVEHNIATNPQEQPESSQATAPCQWFPPLSGSPPDTQQSHGAVSLLLKMVTEMETQYPDIRSRIQMLNNARHAITANISVRMISNQHMSQDKRTQLVSILSQDRASLEEIQRIIQDILDEKSDLSAIIDAIHYKENVEFLNRMIESITGDSREVECYRALMAEFAQSL